MKIPILLTLFILMAMPMTALAKVLTVLPGKSIQEKIDEAEDNDFIAIFGGTYNENLTIDGKIIRLVEVKGQEVTINGDVRFQNISVVPPLEGFTFSGDKVLAFVNCQGEILLRNIDHSEGNRIELAGENSRIVIDSSQINQLISISGSAEISNSDVVYIDQRGGNLNAVKSNIGHINTYQIAEKTVLYRCTIGENYTESKYRSKRLWMGYCTVYSDRSWFAETNDDAKHVIVGCEFDQESRNDKALICINNFNGSDFSIFNSKIHNGQQHQNHDWEDACITAKDSVNSNFLVQNNYLQLSHNNGMAWGTMRFGLNENNKIIIRNNVVVADWNFGVFPFGTLVEGNHSFTAGLPLNSEGGVVLGEGNKGYQVPPAATKFPEEGKLVTAVADLFKDDNVYELSEGSSLIDAGADNALFNDRDGTRNDAGPSGGVWYDPDGWTTDKPVVISFEVSADLVLEGIDTEVILSEGQAVTAPASSE